MKKYISTLTLVILAVILMILIGNDLGWRFRLGFSDFYAPNGEYYPSKTLWDLVDLLIIPSVLIIAAILFTKSQQRRQLDPAQEQKELDSATAVGQEETEHTLAADHQKEQVLQNCLDKITDLILKEKLLQHSFGLL